MTAAGKNVPSPVLTEFDSDNEFCRHEPALSTRPAVLYSRQVSNDRFRYEVRTDSRPGLLNELRDKYAHGQQASLDFLKELFELARDTVAAEKAVAEVPREERGKAALTELLDSLRDADTPIMVEKVVSDVDEVVRAVRFDGWQETRDGDRSVRQALRQTLYVKYKIRDQETYDRAYDYIREYY